MIVLEKHYRKNVGNMSEDEVIDDFWLRQYKKAFQEELDRMRKKKDESKRIN